MRRWERVLLVATLVVAVCTSAANAFPVAYTLSGTFANAPGDTLGLNGKSFTYQAMLEGTVPPPPVGSGLYFYTPISAAIQVFGAFGGMTDGVFPMIGASNVMLWTIDDSPGATTDILGLAGAFHVPTGSDPVAVIFGANLSFPHGFFEPTLSAPVPLYNSGDATDAVSFTQYPADVPEYFFDIVAWDAFTDPGPMAGVIPEPATITLLGLGLAGMIGHLRKRRSTV